MPCDVRFTPESMHLARRAPCPLSANSGHDGSLDHLVRGSRGSPSGYFIRRAVLKNGRVTHKTGKNERNQPVNNKVPMYLARPIYHRRPTIGLSRPSASSALRFLTPRCDLEDVAALGIVLDVCKTNRNCNAPKFRFRFSCQLRLRIRAVT